MTRFLDGAMNDPMQMQHMGKVPGGAFGAFGPFSGSLIHLCNLSEKIRKQKKIGPKSLSKQMKKTTSVLKDIEAYAQG